LVKNQLFNTTAPRSFWIRGVLFLNHFIEFIFCFEGFLIDEAGMVRFIIEKPDTKDHTKEILAISGW